VTAHTKVFQVIEGRNIPDWKKFLSVKENKQALINFFGDFIVKFNQSHPLVPPGNLYYIAGSFGNPETVKVVSDQEVVKPGGSYGCPPLLECCTSQDNQRLPGLKQLSQFPDFQINRQCNTDCQGSLMGYFD
jgi:hypothetical protein